MRIDIQSVHFDADEKLKEFIVKRIEKLVTHFDRIIESNVTLSLEHNHTQIKDKVTVIKLLIPGATLVARERSKIFEESIDLAVDSIRRQLTRHKSKQRNHV